MNGLMVNFESQPKRCEICHQSDCFDASRNLCSRCSDAIEEEPTERTGHDLRMRREYIPIIVGAATGAIVGFISNLFLHHSQNFSVLTGLTLVGGILGLIASSAFENFGD